MRLMDWVKEIRQIADEWLARNYRSIPIPLYVKNLGLLQKISERPGLDRPVSARAILQYLADTLGSKQNLHEEITNLKHRSFFFRLLLKSSSIDVYPLLKSDPDPLVRRMALSDAFRSKIHDDIESWAKDKSVQIRMQILENYVAQETPGNQKLLLSFTTDRNEWIRLAARYYMKRDFDFDAYLYYRTQMTNHPLFINFLVDFSKEEDVQLFVEYVKNEKDANSFTILNALKALDNLGRLELIRTEYFRLLLRKGRVSRFTKRKMTNYFTIEQVIPYRSNFIGNDQALLFCEIMFHMDSVVGLSETIDLLVSQSHPLPYLKLLRSYVFDGSWNPNLERKELVANIRERVIDLSKQGTLPRDIADNLLFILRKR